MRTRLSRQAPRTCCGKEDGNATDAATPIRGRTLAADGRSLVGARATLITNDRTWEDNLVEAPFVVERAGMFHLFYSGNAYFDGRYAVGVARASSPLGPYTKTPDPIVTTRAPWVGPGHNSVVVGPGGDDYLVYHAWREGQVNGPGDGAWCSSIGSSGARAARRTARRAIARGRFRSYRDAIL
ncbi:MAG: family 43 glycosylhydrolase [Kofleriaceae bacterium]